MLSGEGALADGSGLGSLLRALPIGDLGAGRGVAMAPGGARPASKVGSDTTRGNGLSFGEDSETVERLRSMGPTEAGEGARPGLERPSSCPSGDVKARGDGGGGCSVGEAACRALGDGESFAPPGVVRVMPVGLVGGDLPCQPQHETVSCPARPKASAAFPICYAGETAPKQPPGLRTCMARQANNQPG